MRFATVIDYHTHIRQLVSSNGYPAEAHKIKIELDSRHRRTRAVLRADSIVFRDGATLRFLEEILVHDDEINRYRYSYRYIRGEYKFRYERDPDHAEAHTHPLCHLHVNNSDIRYPTHDTSFEEVFKFIMANFYGVTFL